MKKVLVFIGLLVISFTASSQVKISLDEVSKHLGDSVVVTGKVYGTKGVSNGKLLLINLGAAFPNQLLTVVLQDNVQKLLAEPLKSEIQELSVAGKIELYKQKPQMVIKDAAQIQSLITEKPAVKN